MTFGIGSKQNLVALGDGQNIKIKIMYILSRPALLKLFWWPICLHTCIGLQSVSTPCFVCGTKRLFLHPLQSCQGPLSGYHDQISITCYNRDHVKWNVGVKSCAHRAGWRLQPSCELLALVSPPLMSSRHHNLEPYRRWHATIYYRQLGASVFFMPISSVFSYDFVLMCILLLPGDIATCCAEYSALAESYLTGNFPVKSNSNTSCGVSTRIHPVTGGDICATKYSGRARICISTCPICYAGNL